MPSYRFTVVNPDHRQYTGTTQAVDREAAMRYLANTYSVVVSFDEVRERKPLIERRVSGDELLALTQQLAAMLRAGLTVKRALDVLMGDLANPVLQRVLASVSAGLSEGKLLSQALAEHPETFPRLYVFMVQAGEAGGSLPEILTQLALYIEQAEALKRRVKSALYYPVFVLTVAFLISVFIFVFGVHQFQEIYAGFNAPLPWLTRTVMAAGNLVWNGWWVILLVTGGAAALFIRFVRTERGGTWLDRTTLVVPVLGPLLRRVAISRFSRTLSSLYSSGVPLLVALDLVASSMGNRVMETVIRVAMQHVKEGEPLSHPLRESGIFTPMAVSMIASGEESGTLEGMLNEIADFYDGQIDATLRGLVSLLEPVVIVCVGSFIAVLIIALGLPLLNLVEILGQ